MALTRLTNLIASRTGRMLYVNPDDFNASDLISNNGNSPTRPFKTIQRALLEVARFSYVQGQNNDKYDQFTINLSPGDYIIDNRPGKSNTAEVPELSDQSNFDILDPNNDLYKFNSESGGLVVPRGTSLVGMDLRKTRVRPRYVPDPADDSYERTSIFKVTGACYFWQFSLFDALPSTDSSGLGGVYNDPDSTTIVNPAFSHHKVTCFTYSNDEDLNLFYAKSARAFASIPVTVGELESRVQETRIVGPLQQAGQKDISSIEVNGSIATIITDGPHEIFEGQQVTIEDVAGTYDDINGTYNVTSVDNDSQFKIQVVSLPAGSVPAADLTNAIVKAEIDTVDSSSPYIFNCSLRSTWGLCGLWADGSRVSGFKSMVVAQFTGVSLQKDDRAFVKFSEQTTPEPSFVLEGGASDSISLHQDSAGFVYYRGDATTGWRHYHIRVSNNSFIQSVSVFAVGYAEQHLIESGGDYSITNSNSNFGTMALCADGFRPDAFTLDKKGSITHIVPPQALSTQETEVPYYPLDVQKSRAGLSADSVGSKLFLFEQKDPNETPVFNINFFKVGGRTADKIFANLTNPVNSRIEEYSAILAPNGIEEHNITNVDRTTDTFVTQGPNNFETGTPIRIYSNTGYLPLGMESNRLYYVIKVNNTSFKIAPSEEDSRAGAGGAVNSIVNIRSGIPANANLSVKAYVSDTNPELPRFDVSVNANLEEFNTGTFSHGFTTGDKVFFQRRIIAGVTSTGALPLVQTGGSQQALSLTTEYYAIVVNSNTFKIADTESNANNDIPVPIDTNGDASTLTVYRNIQKSPLRFDPAQNGWYLSVVPDITNTIHPILTSSVANNIYVNPSLANTENAYMKRIDDNRQKPNRIYRLRYYIPKEELNARPPLTGYVIRRRTDASNVTIPYNTANLNDQTDDFDRIYFIYQIDTILKHIPGEQNGVYYLTVLMADVSPSGDQFNSPTDTFGFLGYSQDVAKIYPDLDKDNPTADPPAAKTVADNLTHGLVYQDNDRSSITKECVEAFIADCGFTPTLTALTGKATSGQENRLIGFDSTGQVEIDVELRRTSQVRAGNQTFEYTGFGSGNYSTGFPSKQERVLNDKEVLYSQAQRRRAGVVFYSGLNAYGDLYVGNLKINAVTGETETLDEPILRVAGDSAEVGNEEYVPYVAGTKNVNIEGTLVTAGNADKTPNNFNNESKFAEGITVSTKEPTTINRALTTHDVNYRPKGLSLDSQFTNGTVKQTVLSNTNLNPNPGVEGVFKGDKYFKNTIDYQTRHEGYIYVGPEADQTTFVNDGWRSIGLVGTGHLTSIEEDHLQTGVLTDPEPYAVTGKFGINQTAPTAALHVGSGNAIIVGTTSITSNTDIGGNLDVTGYGDFGGTLTVAGETELLSDLDVHGNVTISGNTRMEGDLTINGGDIFSNSPNFNILDTSTTIDFGSSATLITVGTNAGKMVVENPLTEFNGNLQIDGITTSGVTRAEVSTDATEFTFLSNVTSASILNVDAFAGAQKITVGKPGQGSTTVNHDLIVRGDFHVQGSTVQTLSTSNQHAVSNFVIGAGMTIDWVGQGSSSGATGGDGGTGFVGIRFYAGSTFLSDETYTDATTTIVTVPATATAMDVVALGGGGGAGGGQSEDYNDEGDAGGGGGGAGGCGYSQTVSVTAGDSLYVQVGAGGRGGNHLSAGTDGGDSLVKHDDVNGTLIVAGYGGSAGSNYKLGGTGGSYFGDNGGEGGDGANGVASSEQGGGGGGAAGPYGDGGDGASAPGDGADGSTSGAGGGGSGTNTTFEPDNQEEGAGGGGGQSVTAILDGTITPTSPGGSGGSRSEGGEGPVSGVAGSTADTRSGGNGGPGGGGGGASLDTAPYEVDGLYDLMGSVTFTPAASPSGDNRGTLTYENVSWVPSTKTIIIDGDWSEKYLHIQAGPLDSWAQDGQNEAGETLNDDDYVKSGLYDLEDIYWDYPDFNATGERFHDLGGTKTYDSRQDKTTVVFTSTNLGSSPHGGYYLQVREVENVYGQELSSDDGGRRSYRIAYYAAELSEQRTASLMFDHNPATIADRVWRLYNDVTPGKYSDKEFPQTSGRLRLDQILADRYALQVDPFEKFDVTTHQWNSSQQSTDKHSIISSNMAAAIQNHALPQGCVIMWSGSSSNIPEGYAPCDGGRYRCADGQERQAPDLRGRFAVGAGWTSSGRVQATVGSDGGSMGGNLTAKIGGHCLSRHEVPPHTHGFPASYLKHTHDIGNNVISGANANEFQNTVPYVESVTASGATVTTKYFDSRSTLTGAEAASLGAGNWGPSESIQFRYVGRPRYDDGGIDVENQVVRESADEAGTVSRTGPGEGGDDSNGVGGYHKTPFDYNSTDPRRKFTDGSPLGEHASNTLGRGLDQSVDKSGVAFEHFHGIQLSVSGDSDGEAPTEYPAAGKHPATAGGDNPYGDATVSLPTTPPYYSLFYIYKL